MEKMYINLRCYNYNRIILRGYNTLDNCVKDVNVVYEKTQYSNKSLDKVRAKELAFDIMSDMVTSLDYDYVIASCKFINEEDVTNDILKEVDSYYDERDIDWLKKQYPQISRIDFDVDEDNGKPLSICWMKFPYVNEASDGGLFHFTTKNDFDKWIVLSHIATIKDMSRGGIESCQYDEYNGECIPIEDLWDDIRKWKKENGVA